jgi:hypothetical protein
MPQMYFSLRNMTDCVHVQQLTEVILPLTQIVGFCNQITILIVHRVTSVRVLGSHSYVDKDPSFVGCDVTPYVPKYKALIFS